MDRQAPVPSENSFAAYQEHLRLGHEALGRGDARAALESYRRAVAVAGDRSLPHYLVGRALLALGRAEEALAAFDAALARSADDASALAAKADALERLGRTDAAANLRRDLEEADAARRAIADAGGSLPRAELMVGAAERAWQAGRREAALAEWLAAARQHATDGHLDAALDVCQRALIADSGALEVHVEMSGLYVAAGLVEHASERLLLLGRLLELEPDDALRSRVADLVRARAQTDPRLAKLATQLDEPPAG